MAIEVTCQCGRSYQLKDEFAGQRVKCPACGQSIQTGHAVAVIEGDPAFARDKFLLRQKAMAIKSKYYVWDEQGGTILYVERPAYVLRSVLAIFAGLFAGGIIMVGSVALGLAVSNDSKSQDTLMAVSAIIGVILGVAAIIALAVALSPRRHTNFFRDDTKSEQLLEVTQDNKWQVINAWYTLRDPAGQVLARFRKNHLYNFIRRRWYVFNPDGSLLCLAKEDSIILSLLRRLLGDLGRLIRTNFIILHPADERVIGEFNRKLTLLDRYVLDMSADESHYIDRRVALALGVLLDTGERR